MFPWPSPPLLFFPSRCESQRNTVGFYATLLYSFSPSDQSRIFIMGHTSRMRNSIFRYLRVINSTRLFNSAFFLLLKSGDVFGYFGGGNYPGPVDLKGSITELRWEFPMRKTAGQLSYRKANSSFCVETRGFNFSLFSAGWMIASWVFFTQDTYCLNFWVLKKYAGGLKNCPNLMADWCGRKRGRLGLSVRAACPDSWGS